MSAIPPKADIDRACWDVRFVPKADILRCGIERRYSITSSTTAQAKLAGLWIERSEQTRKQPDEMSDAEIAAILRANAN